MPKKAKKVVAKKGRKSSAWGMFIPAGLLAGMGMWFAFGNLPAWLFLGLWIGMALFAIAELIYRK